MTKESIPLTETDKIPTLEECHALMARHAMLPNIVSHSRQVMRVALAVVDHLKRTEGVNRERIIAGALLHDIAKTKSLSTRERHDALGGQLLRSLGFYGIAEIVEQHVFLKDMNPHGRLEEREIVYYADKRVMHDHIVTVQERVEDLICRYGATEEIRSRIRQNRHTILAVEGKINRFMTVNIDDAIRNVSSSLPASWLSDA